METPRLHKRRRLNRNPFVDNTAHDSNVDESSDESLVDPEIWPDDDGGEEPPEYAPSRPFPALTLEEEAQQCQKLADDIVRRYHVSATSLESSEGEDIKNVQLDDLDSSSGEEHSGFKIWSLLSSEKFDVNSDNLPLLFRCNIQVRTFPHFQKLIEEHGLLSFQLPLMPHRLYIEAPSLEVLKSVLLHSPYKTRPRRIPSSQIFDIVRYLRSPSTPPLLHWVRLTCPGPYHGDLGVVSAKATILIMPRLQQLVDDRRRICIPINVGQMTTDLGYDIVELAFNYANDADRGAFVLADPIVDANFIASNRSLLEHRHPDIGSTWERTWKSTWPDGCTAKLKGREGKGVFRHSETSDMAILDNKEIPLEMLSRVYAPGHQLVIIAGQSYGLIATVLDQPDDDMLLLAIVSAHEETSMSHHIIKARNTLDLDRFYFLVSEEWFHRELGIVTAWDGFDDSSLRTDHRPHAERMTVKGTEELIGHEALIVAGHYKGYRGRLRSVNKKKAVVELPGLAEGNKVVHLAFRAVVFRLTNCNLAGTKRYILPEEAPVEVKREQTPFPTAEQTETEEYSRYWKTKDHEHSPTEPCQFLFRDEPPDGSARSYIDLIADKRVLVAFGAGYTDASMFKRLATVDPGRVIPQKDYPEPGYHEVCTTFTDHEGRLCHRNVDICYLKPAPPNAKGQSLLLLCTPNSSSPNGPYGPYIAKKVKKSTKTITVRDEVTKKDVQYGFDQCVRILNDGEKK